MITLFEDGELVKYIIAYAKISTDGYSPGDMIWRPAVIMKTIDFGYMILSDGELKEVHAMDLEKIDDDNSILSE